NRFRKRTRRSERKSSRHAPSNPTPPRAEAPPTTAHEQPSSPCVPEGSPPLTLAASRAPLVTVALAAPPAPTVDVAVVVAGLVVVPPTVAELALALLSVWPLVPDVCELPVLAVALPVVVVTPPSVVAVVVAPPVPVAPPAPVVAGSPGPANCHQSNLKPPPVNLRNKSCRPLTFTEHSWVAHVSAPPLLATSQVPTSSPCSPPSRSSIAPPPAAEATRYWKVSAPAPNSTDSTLM